MLSSHKDISLVILAGGKARRMNQQDKGLFEFNKKPLIKWVIDEIEHKVNNVIISANRNIEEYKKITNKEIIQDETKDFQGPLAGIIKAMSVVDTRYLLVLPCDCPFVENYLVDNLKNQLIKENSDISVACDNQRLQPTFALIKTKLLPSLNQYLKTNNRKIDIWYEKHKLSKVKFKDKKLFANLNNPQDYAKYCDKTKINNVPVLGFSAFSGTGKTTLLTKIIKNLSKQKIKIAFIKHGHHKFEIDYPGKDSYECFHAGAQEVIISSDDKSAKISRKEINTNYLELAKEFDLKNIDLILIEGFKKENFNKIELQRDNLQNFSLYPKDKSIIAIATDNKQKLIDENCNRLIFDINNHQQICDFIISYIKS